MRPHVATPDRGCPAVPVVQIIVLGQGEKMKDKKKAKLKRARISYHEGEGLKVVDSDCKHKWNEHSESTELTQGFALNDNLIVEVEVRNGRITNVCIKPRIKVWVMNMVLNHEKV
jgi:hypothetical protein